GYRSVPLKNSYSEDLELASLLVHMDIVRGRHENGEMLSPFSAVGAMAMQVGRERMGDTSSVSSVSSMSPLPSSPGQALGYRGREGSIEARYQSPLEDFRAPQGSCQRRQPSVTRAAERATDGWSGRKASDKGPTELMMSRTAVKPASVEIVIASVFGQISLSLRLSLAPGHAGRERTAAHRQT
ncbi:hypothetical protein cypCar_00018790, partial [Cyprinus carpio]